MSAGISDHAQLDSVLHTQPRQHSQNPESAPQSISSMSGIAQTRSSIAGGASNQITSNAGVDSQKSGGAVKTRSVDYILRSGLAGGLAGCAVSAYKIQQRAEATLDTDCARSHLGQNCRGPPRSSKNPLPSLESAVCQIHRQLGWPGCCHS